MQSTPARSAESPIEVATPRLFTFKEAASDPGSPLAGRVSAPTLYRLARAGSIPGTVRIGTRVFVTEAGLREFIAQGGATNTSGAKAR